jgi:hypothetical protein
MPVGACFLCSRDQFIDAGDRLCVTPILQQQQAQVVAQGDGDFACGGMTGVFLYLRQCGPGNQDGFVDREQKQHRIDHP